MAERLPLPTPTPVRVGKPFRLFEHTWTVARFEVINGHADADAAREVWPSLRLPGKARGWAVSVR